MKVVIVGGVAAGTAVATRLRRLCEDAQIVLFEQGPQVSYASCGLPYYVGGVIPEEASLLVQTPQALHRRFRLDVRVRHRATRIALQDKVVEVQSLLSGEVHAEAYDYLVLATGSTPRRLDLPGMERAEVLRELQDAVRLKARVDGGELRTAAILGAGFIGVELAENLQHRGVQTTLVEFRDTILSQFDPEMIEPFTQALVASGVRLALRARVSHATEDAVVLDDGRQIPADLLVSAVGVFPETRLAQEAGLRMGTTGGIWVDAQMRTSDPCVFAVGDVAEKTSLLTAQGQMIWLANLAARHGRLVADVLAGREVAARPSIGTGIVGACGWAAALTGLTESQAVRQGVAHRVLHLHPGSHAGYYPGASPVAIKVVFEPTQGRILGGQVVGRDGVDKRTDVLATAIYAGLTVHDLMNLELAYAPQFGSAKDAINQAGYVGDNVVTATTETIQWHELEQACKEGAVLVDVRTSGERERGAIPGSRHIPVDDLRERWQELSGSHVIVHCAVGQRGHTAARLLRAHGLEVRNLDGGYTTWLAGTAAQRRSL